MPRNKIGGNKAKRGKNQQQPKEMVFKTDDQFYAKVTKLLGNCRLEVFCYPDEKTRTGLIRGKMRKRVWVNIDDIVLISTRDFQDNKCDIIHKYNQNEIRKLNTLNEFETKEIEENICSFDFDEI